MVFVFPIFSFWSAVLICSSAMICQPPDKPERGRYMPQAKQYLPGDKVDYLCDSGYVLSGKESRTCKFGGKWTDGVPFCDHPINLRSAQSSSSFNPRFSTHRIIDKNVETCFGTKPRPGEYFRVFLGEPVVVYMIRMYLPEGDYNMAVFTERYRNSTRCTSIHSQLFGAQWLNVYCDHDNPSDTIYVRDISAVGKPFEICEFEVFVKGPLWCRDPPGVFVPHGWLEDVTREKATLKCAEGYRQGDNKRLVCDGKGVWSGGILHCEEILCEWPAPGNASSHENWYNVGRESKLSVGSLRELKCEAGHVAVGNPRVIECLWNGSWSFTNAKCEGTASWSSSSNHQPNFKVIIIAVCSIVGIILLACFLVIVFLVLKRKSKPVVIVVKQGENIYSSIGCAESEYSSISYDAVTATDHGTIRTAKKDILSVETDGYSDPVDLYPEARYVSSASSSSSKYAAPDQLSFHDYANINNPKILKDPRIQANR